jgi:hypothetical protein
MAIFAQHNPPSSKCHRVLTLSRPVFEYVHFRLETSSHSGFFPSHSSSQEKNIVQGLTMTAMINNDDTVVVSIDVQCDVGVC